MTTDFPYPSDYSTWDVDRDGKRFLMMKSTDSDEATSQGSRRINIVLNWIEGLKQLAPMK